MEFLTNMITGGGVTDALIIIASAFGVTWLFKKYKIVGQVLKELGDVINKINDSLKDDKKISQKEMKVIIKEIKDVIDVFKMKDAGVTKITKKKK